jgi:nitroreductase
LLVFLDKSLSYSIEKDNQSLGAFVENMLLKITDLELGGCWIGEIAKNSNQVKQLCEINNDNLQLACAIAIGYPEHVVKTPKKKFQEIVIGKK